MPPTLIIIKTSVSTMASNITSDCNKTDILISFGHSGTTYCPEQDTTPQHFLSSRHIRKMTTVQQTSKPIAEHNGCKCRKQFPIVHIWKYI
jgi:hypothetical protein